MNFQQKNRKNRFLFFSRKPVPFVTFGTVPAKNKRIMTHEVMHSAKMATLWCKDVNFVALDHALKRVASLQR